MLDKILNKNADNLGASKDVLDEIISICEKHFHNDQPSFTKRTTAVKKIIEKLSKEEFDKK